MYNFVFDKNKCVGCGACAIACKIQNNTDININYRQISTYNYYKMPEIPVFYFSLSCNHCEKPLCLKNCPALAYTKDEKSGAVLHDASKCIGCKYCTWACPYDAPKFNDKTKTIEKCNFCIELIKNDDKPNCAKLCPTGALSFETTEKSFSNQNILGFTENNIKPSIKIIPLRKENVAPILATNEVLEIKNYNILKVTEPKKITAKKEMPLIIFTLLVANLVSIFTASSLFDFHFNEYIFFGLACFSVILSSLHLGKKQRAYRAVFNIANSWLSREIFLFAAFVGTAFISTFLLPDNELIKYITIIVGIFTLFSIDMVYKLAVHKHNMFFNSGQVTLTAALLFALFIKNKWLLLLIVLIKSILYIYRNYKKISVFAFNIKSIIFSLRLDFLISFPVIFALISPQKMYIPIVISILIGELFDRIEFYNDLEIKSPITEINNTLKISVCNISEQS